MEPYYEIQKFNKWWMRLLFVIPVLIVIWGIASGKTQDGDYSGLYAAIVVLALLTALSFFTKLETRMDEEGITIRFFPFQRVYYYVKWDTLESVEVRTYNPLREYGGWGLRYSFTHGKAYNVAGNKGIQLVLKSGKKFLIGTQQPQIALDYLRKIQQQKQIPLIDTDGRKG